LPCKEPKAGSRVLDIRKNEKERLLVSDQRDSRRSDNWVAYGLGGLTIVLLVLIQGVPMLVTFGVIEPLHYTLSNQAFLSCALYGALTIAIGVRIWAGLQKHNHIRWCSIPTIVNYIVVYSAVAYGWSVNHSSILMDAVLHPILWVASNFLSVATWTLSVAAAISIIRSLRRYNFWAPPGLNVLRSTYRHGLSKTSPRNQRTGD
jgi:hypothetical protein